MAPEHEARLLTAINGVRSEINAGFESVRKEIGDVSRETSKNTQRLDDLRCTEMGKEVRSMREEHNRDVREIRDEMVTLKISDVTQDGELKLKFSVSSLLLQLLVGVIAMVPVGIGAYVAIMKAIEKTATVGG